MKPSPTLTAALPLHKLLKPARKKYGCAWRNKEGLAAIILLAPSFAGTMVFVLLPLLDALRRSFFSAMGGRFTGVSAYRAVLSNEAFRLAAANTAKFTAVCLPVLLVVSFGVALAVYSAADNMGLLKTSFLLPLAIPTASVVAVWQLLFDRSGILNGITGVDTDWLNSPAAFWVLVGTYLWKNCGYNMILWLSGFYAIPESWYEAARVDGAGWAQRLWYITIPSMKPHLFTITALSILNSFKVFREAYLLGGNYPYESIYLLQHLFNNWFAFLNVDKLCAAAAMLAAALFLVIAIVARLLREEDA